MSEFALGKPTAGGYGRNGAVSQRSARPRPEASPEGGRRKAGTAGGAEAAKKTAATRGRGEAASDEAPIYEAYDWVGENAAAGLSPEATARASRGPAKSRALERGFGLVLAALGLCLVLGAGFLLLPSTLKVSRYVIRGASTMSSAEVLSAALIHGSEYFFSLDVGRIQAALLAEPRIARASVTRVFPNELRLEITERRPVALVLVESEGRLRPVFLDAEGVAFAWALGAGKGGVSQELPVISGLRFEGFRLGTRLPSAFSPTLASIGELGATSPGLLAAFSEIKLVKPGLGEAELLLFPLHHHVHVRTGAVLNEATLRSIILVLDVLGGRGQADELEEIDFRTGTVVYRVKGGQAG
jgi:cell division protein FtsQ